MTAQAPQQQDAQATTDAGATPEHRPNEIGKKAVRGVAWLAGGQLLRQAVGLLTTIALARLLTPDDFGLFSMTYIASEAAQILTNFGFGAAIVQRREASPSVLSTCFWANIFLAVAVGILLIALGPVLAAYFQRQEITGLVVPLAFNMVLSAAIVVPQALLSQRLQFREQTLAQFAGSLAAAVTVVLAALGGMGYWSLAMQPLVGSTVTLAIIAAYARWRPGAPSSLKAARGLIDFSSYVLGANLFAFVGRNMPTFIIGRMLGAAALAIYGLAGGITGTIVYQISSVIVRVLFPTLSALKDDPVRLQAAWLKSCTGIAAISFPILAAVIAGAPDIVLLAFGPKWIDAVGPLRVLCISMAVQAVFTTAASALLATGFANVNFRLSVITAPAFALALWQGCHHGITGASIGFTIVSVTSYLATAFLACRATGLALMRLLSALAPWTLAPACGGVVMALTSQAAFDLGLLVRLSLGLIAGAVTCIVVLLLTARRPAMELWRDLSSRMRG